MSTKWVALVALALGLACWSGEARADTRDPSAAEALFRAGREAFESGDYATALARFDEAYRLDPTLGALLNRAISEDELGQLTRAWEDYRKVLERLDASDPRVEIASSRLRELERRLAWVTIKLEGGTPAQTTVTRRSVALGKASVGIALPVDPGRHEFVATAPGYRSRTYVLNVVEGERRELLIGGLVPLPPKHEPPPGVPPSAHSGTKSANVAGKPPEPQVDGSSGSRTLGYVLLGAGGVGMGVAAVSGVMLIDRLNTVDAHCRDKQCDDAGYEAGESGRRLRLVTGIALAAGAVCAGLGGYILLSGTGGAEVGWRGSF
jgi:hypothetical protein